MVNRSYLVAAALLAACSIPDVTFTRGLPDAAPGDAGSDGTGVVNRTITARWTLKHFTTGALFTCAHTSDVARVVAQPWDPVTQLTTGAPIVTQDFACTAGMGVFTVPSDKYRMSVAIRTAAGQVLEDSAIEFADATQRDGTLQVTIFDDAGYLAFSWDLLNKATQARVSCATAGITPSDRVEIDETNLANPGNPISDLFNCDDHFGTTDGLIPGHYSLSIRAVKNSATIGDVATFADVQVVAGGVTDLGNIKLPVPVN